MEQGFAAAVDRVTSEPIDAFSTIALAESFVRSGRPDLAITLYRVWLQFHASAPGRPILEFNLSVLLDRAGLAREAGERLSSALRSDPEFLEAYINLGGLLERGGDLKAAVETWSTGVERLAPVTGARLRHKAVLMKQIARVLLARQMYAAAEGLLVRCLELDPDQEDAASQLAAARLSLCRRPLWTPQDPLPRARFLQAVQPLSLAAYVDDPVLLLAAAHAYTASTVPRPGTRASDRRFAATRIEGRRIRVGYVSSDLRDHAIGYLLAEVVELHDRTVLETFAYACGPTSQTPLTERLRGAFEHWREIGDLNDADAAALIAADEVDVLVDVNGLTKDARTGVFAHRPAPIQMNWLGFPGSMGTSFHNYIVADGFIIPEAFEALYSERVLRLQCYQPNDRRRSVAERPTRAEAGLPEEGFVYCCFNGSQKITASVFGCWLDILERTPGSVLWLLASTEETHAGLRTAAERRGIEPGRLIFAPKLANAHHLARYPLADLFLDTFPYGAHTTASDALFMGVPVLTLAGLSFASRVCGSLLQAAGLPELICSGPEAYVARAVQLGGEPGDLSAYRARLEALKGACRLFDMDALAAELSTVYRQACLDHEAGLTPEPNLMNLELYHEIGAGLWEEDRRYGSVEALTSLYRAELATRHLSAPVPPDDRIWAVSDQRRAEAALRPKCSQLELGERQ